MIHFSSFFTVQLLFKCRFVAWQRGLSWKIADCVFLLINARSFEPFMYLDGVSAYPCQSVPRFDIPLRLSRMMSSKRWELHVPYFEAGSGYYGETLGKFNEGAVRLSQDLLLSFLGKIKCLRTIFLFRWCAIFIFRWSAIRFCAFHALSCYAIFHITCHIRWTQPQPLGGH